MIPGPLESALKTLAPTIVTHDLVIVGPTAAALHAMTCRHVTGQVDLATRRSLPRSQAAPLHDALVRVGAALRATPVATTLPTAVHPMDATVTDDHLTFTLPTTGTSGPGDGLLTINVTLVDRGLQPIVDDTRTAPRRGARRYPTLDQLTVAQHAFTTWLDNRHDPTIGADLGLAVDRVGPEPLTATLPPGHLNQHRYRLTSAVTAAVRRVTAVPTTQGTRARAEAGLTRLHDHLTNRTVRTVRDMSR